MEFLSTAINTISPSIRSWTVNPKNKCIFEEIPVYWETYDVITFLADLRTYHQMPSGALEKSEKEQEQKFKTEYFKKRFTLSRTLLKHIVQNIPGTDQPSDILMAKDTNGRIIVPARPDICISLSYSDPWIAITIGKRKIGSDIEVVRPVRAEKITSCPVFNNFICTNDQERMIRIIHLWTLIESFAKLYDKNPYSLLETSSFCMEATFVSYCINRHSIYTLASGQEQFADTLVWLDSAGMEEHLNTI